VGNGFPGLAVVSTIALLVALGVGALAILQPWETDAVAPQLSVAPGLGVGLGDSVVVARDRQLAVESAQPAAGGAPRFAAADISVDKGEPQPRLGIAPAHVVVASLRPSAPSRGSPQPSQPEPTPVPQPTPVPAVVPVAAPPPPAEPVATPPTRGAGGGTSGPIGAGGGDEEEEGGTGEVLQVCEGDDYTLPLSPVEGAEGSEVPPPVVTHDLTVYFGSSGEGTGFHLVLFDGQAVEIGEDVVPTEPGKSCAQIDLGLLLGESIEAGTEIRIEAVKLGEELEPVVP
jgi:hypothetical protein